MWSFCWIPCNDTVIKKCNGVCSDESNIKWPLRSFHVQNITNKTRLLLVVIWFSHLIIFSTLWFFSWFQMSFLSYQWATYGLKYYMGIGIYQWSLERLVSFGTKTVHYLLLPTILKHGHGYLFPQKPTILIFLTHLARRSFLWSSNQSNTFTVKIISHSQRK